MTKLLQVSEKYPVIFVPFLNWIKYYLKNYFLLMTDHLSRKYVGLVS